MQLFLDDEYVVEKRLKDADDFTDRFKAEEINISIKILIYFKDNMD